MKRFPLKIAYLLGPINILRVLMYRIQVKTGWRLLDRYVHEAGLQGPFFHEVKKQCHLSASENWRQQAWYFGWWTRALNAAPPDWEQNPINQKRICANRPWWKITDFDTSVGDVKLIWEASRFSWVLIFSQRILRGERDLLIQLNQWLIDWCEKNPPYLGANWKCGQEAAIRVMNSLVAK